MEAEFEEIDSKGSWASVFQQIKNECSNFEYTCQEARKTQNKNLNRYRDVSPFDHSRVKLLNGECDYINASLVKVPAARRSYILTQGPLPNTTSHFWQMVWEQNSKAVLMLNKVIEKNMVKCHQYWPLGRTLGAEDDMTFNDVGLKVEHVGDTEYTFYTVRELKLTDLKSGNSRTVLHFHYTTWPDFGVPQSPSAFLTFLHAVRKMGVLEEDVGPPIVHCSAGIGRSGTFCLVDTCLVLIEKSRDMNSVKILDVLREMRKYRMGLIQTPDQLRFSYVAIIEGAKKILNTTQKREENGNVDGENNSIRENDDEHSASSNQDDSEATERDPLRESLPTFSPPTQPDFILQRRNDAEARRLQRQERFAKTSEMIAAMKKKQEACEKSRRRSRSLSPSSSSTTAVSSPSKMRRTGKGRRTSHL